MSHDFHHVVFHLYILYSTSLRIYQKYLVAVISLIIPGSLHACSKQIVLKIGRLSPQTSVADMTEYGVGQL